MKKRREKPKTKKKKKPKLESLDIVLYFLSFAFREREEATVNE